MSGKLNQKDVRALKLGAAGVAAIIVLLSVLDFQESWVNAKATFETTNAKLATLSTIDMTGTKYSGLMSAVPVFQMPEEKEKQKFLFRDSLNTQLKKSNVNSQPWQEIAGKRALIANHEVMRLKTSGKCNVNQLFDLLANLKENPCLICIDELMIRLDTQNKQQVTFDITLSTPVKKKQ
jgi:hypothetical protein